MDNVQYISITTLPYQESQYNTNTNIMNNTYTISTSSTYSYSSIQIMNLCLVRFNSWCWSVYYSPLIFIKLI